MCCLIFVFFFQAEDGIRDLTVTGVQTCALPISLLAAGLAATPNATETLREQIHQADAQLFAAAFDDCDADKAATRSEEHTSELQSQSNLVCRLLLEKKKKR